jgi:hypothetical protein
MATLALRGRLPFLFSLRNTIIAFLALLHFTSLSIAGEIEELSVVEKDGEYRLRIIEVLDAPADYVYNVITDYTHAYRINPAITEVEILPTSDDAVIRVRNHSEHWVGPLSFKIDWVGDITEGQEGHIKVVTVPELSSFESGSAYWHIQSEGQRTRVIHESRLKPKFFVLPVVGDLLMKKYLQEDTLATFNRIECNAMIMLERDMENDTKYLKTRLTSENDCSNAQETIAFTDP